MPVEERSNRWNLQNAHPENPRNLENHRTLSSVLHRSCDTGVAKTAMPTANPDDRLFTTRWVHLHEQDSAAGDVYAPEDGPVPLSRRPRQRLELRPDGSATLYTGGADDRPTPTAARWSNEGDHMVVRTDSGNAVLRIVEKSPTRLVIARS